MSSDFSFNKKACFVAAVAILASICVTSDFVSPEFSLMVNVNRFHLKLYSLVINNVGLSENLIMSPFSLHSVLSMLTLGAGGDTETEMLNALGFTKQFLLIDSHTSATNQLNNIVGVTISTANRIYISDDLTLNKTFSKKAMQVFSAGAKDINFRDQTAAAKTINTWVEKKTNQKIKNLITPDMLSPLTALVLVNALYFKGFWDKPFNPVRTTSETFTTLEGNEVQVEMMQQKNSFLYGSFEENGVNFQMLEMFYKFKSISMVIILPEDITDAFKKIEKIDQYNFKNAYLENLKAQNVTVKIPKFKIETRLELNDYLPQMGFKKMFGGGDLSGLITNKVPLQVSHVIQKAFIEVNELGTEAAAATAVIVERSAPQFICNRPFLFYIIDKSHGKILFAGRKVA